MSLAFYKSWSARRRRWVLGCAVAFFVYTLAGFFLLPVIIKAQLEKNLSLATKRVTKVRQVRFNPLVLSLTIRGLSLAEPDGRIFASLDEFYVNFQLSSLFRWAYTFKEIRLDRPFGEIILRKDGTFNFANMVSAEPESPKQPSPGGLPRLRIFLLSVTNGFVAFEDQTRTKPFRTDHRPINIRLTDLATRPGSATPYSFAAENDSGTTLSWSGNITAQPFSSKGYVEVKGADPKKYQPYIDDYTKAEIADGKMDLRLDYYLSAGTNGVDMVVSNAFAEFNNLKIRDPEKNEVVFSMPSLTVKEGGLNLRERTLSVADVSISNVELLTRLNQGGKLNLLELIKPPALSHPVHTNHPGPSGPPWIVSVERFSVTNAGLAFEDLSRKTKFETRLSPIMFSVAHLSTRTNSEAEFAFSCSTELQEVLGAGGAFSISPLRSSGKFQLTALSLPKYRPYADQFLKGSLSAGKCDFGLEYRVSLEGADLAMAVSNAFARLSNLEVQAADTNETIIKVPGFAIEQGEASLGQRFGHVGLISTKGGSLVVRRNGDSSLNLLSLLQPPQGHSDSNAPAPAPAQAADAKAWTAKLDEFKVADYAISCEDLVPAKPFRLNLHHLDLTLKGASTDLTSPILAEFATGVDQGGKIGVTGEGRVSPGSATVDIVVSNLDLRPLQPYLQQHLNLGISSALFGMRGSASYSPEASPRALFRGALRLSKVVSTDLAAFHEFVKWDDLQLEGIDFQSQPDSLDINSVKLDGLGVTVLVDTNKQLNLTAVLPGNTNSSPVAASTPVTDVAGKKSPPFPFSIQTFAMSGGGFVFNDQSLQPTCRFQVEQLGGTVKGLSSKAGTPAEVDFTGKFDERSAFAVIGTVQPITEQLAFSLSFSNSNLQLPVFTPYTEKFAGHPLNKGRLSMNLRYDVQQGELKAQNRFRIDQLMFGPRNQSPDATSLPVKLGVALLKDSEGKIELDVPLSGRLDDPQFRVGPIIWKVVMNMITKAVTSPFKLLGALVGGGEELAYLEFVPGTAQLIEGETNKLAKLVKALEQRPALNLEIEALADPQVDREALARQDVREQLKVARLKELSAANQLPGSPETFQIDELNYERLLRAALLKEFGTNLNSTLESFASTISTNASGAAGNPPAKRPAASGKKPGLGSRLLSYLPFGSDKNPLVQERRRAKADSILLKQNPVLAALGVEQMERLLATKTTVAPDRFRDLMQARGKAVEAEFIQSGLTSERLFLVGPKPIDTLSAGQPRVNLSLN